MRRILLNGRFLTCAVLALAFVFGLHAADPTATDYSASECQGSAIPYPGRTVAQLVYPDSLTPVFLNHVGRHGARFLSSSKYTTSLMRALQKADSLHSITSEGRELMNICRTVVSRTAGRWGALDSLGMAEQRAIASRAFTAFRPLFDNTRINAISSYVPRCILSMSEFTHQLSRLDNKVEITTSSGRQNSPLLRPWDSDSDYAAFMDAGEWRRVYDDFLSKYVPVSVAVRVLGRDYPFEGDDAKDVVLNIYKVLTGCAAMSLEVDMDRFFTDEEMNAVWSVENLHHYLTHSSSTLSSAPADMSSALLENLLTTMREAVEGRNPYSVMLRFGHAETLMPLFALMHLPGCYYMTNYFDTVGLHWRDFYIVPMAANLQMILFRADSGRYYVRTDLNETPVPLIPGRSAIYTPWEAAEEYLVRCLPLHMQI